MEPDLNLTSNIRSCCCGGKMARYDEKENTGMCMLCKEWSEGYDENGYPEETTPEDLE